jgi:hypothetical protein
MFSDRARTCRQNPIVGYTFPGENYLRNFPFLVGSSFPEFLDYKPRIIDFIKEDWKMSTTGILSAKGDRDAN